MSDPQQEVQHRCAGEKYTEAGRGSSEERLTVSVLDLPEPWRAQQHTSCVPQEGAVVQQPRQQGRVEPRQDVISAEVAESRRVRKQVTSRLVRFIAADILMRGARRY